MIICREIHLITEHLAINTVIVQTALYSTLWERMKKCNCSANTVLFLVSLFVCLFFLVLFWFVLLCLCLLFFFLVLFWFGWFCFGLVCLPVCLFIFILTSFKIVSPTKQPKKSVKLTGWPRFFFCKITLRCLYVQEGVSIIQTQLSSTLSRSSSLTTLG